MPYTKQNKEAIEIMKKCGISSPHAFFGKNLTNNINILLCLANETAPALHENIIKEFATENGDEAQKWRIVEDTNFIKSLDLNNLPTYIRSNNGVIEIDLAHTPFENLSADWQYENVEAAKIVAGLVIRGQYEALSRQEIGDIIHTAWLERNDWAKTDEVLGLPYDKLPESEKVKDDKHYIICSEVLHEMQSESEGMGTN